MKIPTSSYITPLSFGGDFLTWHDNVLELLARSKILHTVSEETINESVNPGYTLEQAEQFGIRDGLADFVCANDRYYRYLPFNRDTRHPFPGTYEENLSAISIIKSKMEPELTAFLSDGKPPKFAAIAMGILRQQFGLSTHEQRQSLVDEYRNIKMLDGETLESYLKRFFKLRGRALKAATEAASDPEAPSFGDLDTFKTTRYVLYAGLPAEVFGAIRNAHRARTDITDIFKAVAALRNAARDIAPHRPTNNDAALHTRILRGQGRRIQPRH
ncbi:hypothetical protein HDU67_007525 [Dinochytrium kinnereticum]|nr:hypothetical protein HDU67_007525 [Dinochytrium kinnereticum]